MDGSFRKMERNSSMNFLTVIFILFTIGFIGQSFCSENAYGYGILAIITWVLFRFVK
jgi:hypothetical protein